MLRPAARRCSALLIDDPFTSGSCLDRVLASATIQQAGLDDSTSALPERFDL